MKKDLAGCREGKTQQTWLIDAKKGMLGHSLQGGSLEAAELGPEDRRVEMEEAAGDDGRGEHASRGFNDTCRRYPGTQRRSGEERDVAWRAEPVKGDRGSPAAA